MGLLILLGVVALHSTVNAGEKTITTSEGLTVGVRDGNLTSVRVATADGGSKNLVRGHAIIADPLGAETPDMIPVNLYTEPESADGSLAVGSSNMVNSPVMRSWISVYVPKDRNLVFVRTRLMAKTNIRLKNSELNFRIYPIKFYDKVFWLPGAEPCGYDKDRDYVSVGLDAPIRMILPKATDRTGIFFSDGKIAMAYSILSLSDGDYWQARIADNTSVKDMPMDNGWGGELSPMFRDVCQGSWKVIIPSVKQGRQFLSEYCLSVSPDPDPAKMAAMMASEDFRRYKAMAQKAFDRVEADLLSLEGAWNAAAIKDVDPRQVSEDLKVRAVQMQVRVADVESVLANARIRADLSGKPIQEGALGKEIADFAKRSETELNHAANKLNSASAGIGDVFSTTRDMAKARKAFDQAAKDLAMLLDRIGTEASGFEGKFKELAWSFPADRTPRSGKLFDEEPLHGVCWFDTEYGPDSAKAELRKMKALGMNVVETASQPYAVDGIHLAAQENDWTSLDALLKLFRASGMKAMVGVENTLFANTPEAANAIGLPSNVLAPQYNPFSKPAVPNYENMAFQEFSRDAFGRMAEYLKSNYSDVVWGFDYNNEMGWMRNTSPEAKTNFIAYMKEKYGAISNLNQAWARSYASWKQFEESFAGVKELVDGKLGNPAKIEWHRYEGYVGYGRGFWQPVYDGLKAGFPEAVRIGRCPGEGILNAQTARHKMTDVVDHHWMLWGDQIMAQHLRAFSGGKPFANSELWWVHWQSREKEKTAYGEEIVRQTDKYRTSPMFEDLRWGQGCDQMWNYFVNGCNGFWWFLWPGHGFNNSMVRPNGLVFPAIAKLAPVIRESSLLSPLIRQTEMDAELAVYYPTSRKNVISAAPSAAPVFALQALNYQHNVLTEEQIAGGALSGYKYLLVAHGEVMPEQISTAIREWIRNGGTLIATGRIGVLDELGKPSPILSSALSVKYPKVRGKNGLLTLSGEADVPLTPLRHFIPGQLWSRNTLRTCTENNAPWDIELSGKDWKALGKYDDGKLAAAEVKLGKGKAILCGAPVETLIWEHALAGQLNGDAFNAAATGAFRSLLDAAGVIPPVRIDKRGELTSDNVQMFVRRAPGDPSRRVVFLLNIGHPVADVGGGAWTTLPYIAEPQKVKISINAPIRKVREVVRDTEVPFSSKDGVSAIEVKLEPHRIYALEISN